MDLEELNRVLEELRMARSDHRTVEAKRANRGLPSTTAESMSAFANTDDGGLLVFGVDEGDGSFLVTGVADPRQIQSDIQALCVSMKPAIRATIDILEHEDGIVVTAFIPSIARSERPCHKEQGGPFESSFIRIGDGDQKLTRSEIEAMLANQAPGDRSLMPALQDSNLDPALVSKFINTVQESNDRYKDLPQEQILKHWGARLESGELTYAGMLSLGENPERGMPAARITYRRHPRETDPAGTRYSATHFDGTYGELLEQAMKRLGQDLNSVVVVRDGNTIKELDVPMETLREVISNALVHRSLANGQRDISVLIEVSDDAVVITSPGGLISTADTTTLGLNPLAGTRNPSLIRICEQVTSPSGWQIVEHQGTGIAAADRACRRNQTMPIVFLDGPASFLAIMLRGSLDTNGARELLEAEGLEPTENEIRLISVLDRLVEIRDHIAITSFNQVNFDAHFAARALSATSVEDASAIVRKLEDAGVLIGQRISRTPSWKLAKEVGQHRSIAGEATVEDAPNSKKSLEESRLVELLEALKAAHGKQLSVKEIGVALGLKTAKARNKWIEVALNKGLVLSTVTNMYDPARGFRITPQGEAFLEAQVDRIQK